MEENWKDSLPEEIRNDPSLETIQDIPNLAKSYVNAQKLVGADKVILPKGEEDVDGWNRVFEKLGRPESPDKYTIEPPENLKNIPELEKGFRELAHKQGLNNKQVKDLYNWYEGQVTEASAKAQAERESALVALKTEYGSDYEKHIDNAKKAAVLYGGEDFKAYLDNSGLGNDPTIIKFLAKVGALTKEDSVKGTPAAPATNVQEEINKIINDKNSAYHDRFAPGHAAMVAKVTELFGALKA